MKKVVILISGRGSNMQAIVNANIPNMQVVAVISNKEDAQGLFWANERGVPTRFINHKDFESRESFDKAMANIIDEYSPDLVVLAGFMRILTPEFCQHFQGKMINIHPSILPSFQGLHTHERAIEMGCKVAGCSVHFVTADLDGGPIIAQAVVPVLASDDADSLARRVLKCEHKIYPQVVADFVSGNLKLENGCVVYQKTNTNQDSFLISHG